MYGIMFYGGLILSMVATMITMIFFWKDHVASLMKDLFSIKTPKKKDKIKSDKKVLKEENKLDKIADASNEATDVLPDEQKEELEKNIAYQETDILMGNETSVLMNTETELLSVNNTEILANHQEDVLGGESTEILTKDFMGEDDVIQRDEDATELLISRDMDEKQEEKMQIGTKEIELPNLFEIEEEVTITHEKDED